MQTSLQISLPLPCLLLSTLSLKLREGIRVTSSEEQNGCRFGSECLNYIIYMSLQSQFPPFINKEATRVLLMKSIFKDTRHSDQHPWRIRKSKTICWNVSYSHTNQHCWHLRYKGKPVTNNLQIYRDIQNVPQISGVVMDNHLYPSCIFPT